MPGCKYTVKVRAYKDGVYGKFKSIKANTLGSWGRGIVCNSCGAVFPYYEGNKPGWDYTHWVAEHSKAVQEVLGEHHAGTLFW